MIASGIIAQLRIGRPQPLPGHRMLSAYRRQPVSGPVTVHELGLDGDQVGNTRVHGGPEKAIYAYPLSGYAAWRAEFPDLAGRFEPGAMGENLVVDGFDETSLCLGDVIRCGTATLQIAQIREPCSTFAAAMGTTRVVKAMVRSGRCGWYFRVLEAGTITAGNGHDVIERPNPAWPISRFTPIAAGKAGRHEELAELAALPGLSAYWRAKLARRLADQQQ
ncbi:MOSC domain-containing protein [Sandarakinorhabdus sp.]|jgi:MOSC domain-containing protein YiiM|uniref:MOSC domain-containing protein n=1 Tax=Sandarakinorhabdus sp. TaxID=1916663 RepID=UPI0028A59FF1|nr:MOSC domain-containing protein [Sandarakinorhabdus sp.]